jgi:predicted Rossmann fold nucleotide-binding protein DprA/Smf involved in DNA uptake
MPRKSQTRQPKPPKPMKERVVKAAGRRPLGRDQIAAKLDVSPNAVARALGQATAEGKLVKTERGYQRT